VAALSIVVTGSGSPRPNPDRAGPGVYVSSGEVAVQLDAGRGTVMRLAAAGVELSSLDAVLVTHHHSDHLTGLADLVMTRWLTSNGEAAPLRIVAPSGPAVTFVSRMLEPYADDIEVRSAHAFGGTKPHVVIEEFAASSRPEVVWSHGDVVVSSIAVHHEPVVPAVAYRVDHPHGAVVVSGDTRVCDEIAMIAAGADVVVHEAVRKRAMAAMIAGTRFEHIFDYHADSIDLGAQAAEVGVPMLVLTHLIPSVGVGEFEGFRDDIRAGGFSGRLCVADDLLRIEVCNGEIVATGSSADV
jgi:ribonuclease Z